MNESTKLRLGQPLLPSYVLVGERKQRLLDWGSRSAVPIVLLHSLGLDLGLWQPAANLLKDRFRVIVPDLMGHSPCATTPMTGIAAVADEIAKLLQGQDVGPAIVVGLSLGGAVAQEFVLRHPHRVTGLGLVATVMKGVPAFVERAEKAEQEGLAPQLKLTLERWFTKGQIGEDHEGVRYAREMLNGLDCGFWAAAWRALAAHDAADRLAKITVPTLCIAGERDPSTPPELVRGVADLILAARFETIANAPHLLSLTNSCELAVLLSTILPCQSAAR